MEDKRMPTNSCGTSLMHSNAALCTILIRMSILHLSYSIFKQFYCYRSLPHAVKETTWVHKIFGGRLRSRVICRSCGHPSDTFDSLLDLSIDVPKRSSIRLALDAFVAIDVLAGADKYKCEKCEKPVVAEKQFTIHEAPQVLTIHLKRFTPLGRKMTHLVRYDEHLSLQKYMSAGQVRHSPIPATVMPKLLSSSGLGILCMRSSPTLVLVRTRGTTLLT